MRSLPSPGSIVLDGVQIPMDEAGRQLLEQLQRQLADNDALVAARDASIAALRTEQQAALDALAGRVAAIPSAHQAELDRKDGELAALKAAHTAALAAKDGEIAGLRSRIPTGDELDSMVAARERTLGAAEKILGRGYKLAGRSDAEIRRDTVAARLGGAAVEGKSDEYIRACFDTLTAPLPGRDPIRDAVLRPGPSAGAVQASDLDTLQQQRDAARRQRNRDLEEAWQKPPGKG